MKELTTFGYSSAVESRALIATQLVRLHVHVHARRMEYDAMNTAPPHPIDPLR